MGEAYHENRLVDWHQDFRCQIKWLTEYRVCYYCVKYIGIQYIDPKLLS